VVTVNVLGAPAVKVALLALVMVGVWANAVETIAANARHDISHDASIDVAAKTRLRERGACGIIYVAIKRRSAPWGGYLKTLEKSKLFPGIFSSLPVSGGCRKSSNHPSMFRKSR
jgi:hypothetical protein